MNTILKPILKEEKIDSPESILNEYISQLEKETNGVLKGSVDIIVEKRWEQSHDDYNEEIEVEREYWLLSWIVYLPLRGGYWYRLIELEYKNPPDSFPLNIKLIGGGQKVKNYPKVINNKVELREAIDFLLESQEGQSVLHGLYDRAKYAN